MTPVNIASSMNLRVLVLSGCSASIQFWPVYTQNDYFYSGHINQQQPFLDYAYKFLWLLQNFLYKINFALIQKLYLCSYEHKYKKKLLIIMLNSNARSHFCICIVWFIKLLKFLCKWAFISLLLLKFVINASTDHKLTGVHKYLCNR